MSNETDAAKIKRLKEELKKEPIAKRLFKKYDRPISDVDKMSVEFVPLDVSAKTIDGDIFLNENMKDKSDEHILAYLLHESAHFCQHLSNKCLDEESITDDNYLDNPSEQEAFRAQLDYKLDNESKEEVKDYLTQLFDRYDLSRKERKEKMKELLPKGKI